MNKFVFQKAFFSKSTSRDQIVKIIKEEGFKPKLISDQPGFIYELHKHPETKYLACLEGSMRVRVQNDSYLFEPGDKLIIPGNTLHSAIVGEKGCIFLWSEKIIP